MDGDFGVLYGPKGPETRGPCNQEKGKEFTRYDRGSVRETCTTKETLVRRGDEVVV